MSAHRGASDAGLGGERPEPQLVSLGWALRRTALWLLMLSVIVVAGAWLLYASIEPDEAAAGPQASELQPMAR